MSATRKTPAWKDKYPQTLTQETTDQVTDSSPSKKTRMSWSQEKIKKRKKYCDNLPLVGIERCEAHDKKRQDEKDKDESPECVNNTHGQRDGQGACKKMKMAIFYILCLDDPRKRSPWIRLLWFPASASLSLFSDDHTSLISNWDQQEFWYLHEVLTVFAILCSLPIITKKN